MEVTLDTTLGALLDNPQAKAVAMAKGMSLKAILSMPQAAQLGLTEEKAEQILAEINKQL
jgi:hypothetical protein